MGLFWILVLILGLQFLCDGISALSVKKLMLEEEKVRIASTGSDEFDKLFTSVDSIHVWSGFKSLLNAKKGENSELVLQLKKYLTRFGYLSKRDTMTAVFDDEMEAAVKLYQERFGVQITGRLDAYTLEQMMRPRCGREDVEHNMPRATAPSPSTSRRLALGKPGGNGNIGVSHFTYFDSQWTSKFNLTYAFLKNSETELVSQNDRRQVFAGAFAAWSAVAPINFREIQEYEIADIKISFKSFDHGDEEPFDGPLGVLAHSFPPEDGRLHLDNSEYWTVNVHDAKSKQAIDLYSVVLHEIGHLVGLGHSQVQGAVMFPSILPRQERHQLADDDIMGIQSLYGIKVGYNPSNGVQDTDMKSSTAGMRLQDQSLPRLLVLLAAFWIAKYVCNL